MCKSCIQHRHQLKWGGSWCVDSDGDIELWDYDDRCAHTLTRRELTDMISATYEKKDQT